jgi:hypothetical protein
MAGRGRLRHSSGLAIVSEIGFLCVEFMVFNIICNGIHTIDLSLRFVGKKSVMLISAVLNLFEYEQGEQPLSLLSGEDLETKWVYATGSRVTAVAPLD